MKSYIAVIILEDDSNAEDREFIVRIIKANTMKLSYMQAKETGIELVKHNVIFKAYPLETCSHFLEIKISPIENNEANMLEQKNTFTFYERVSTFWNAIDKNSLVYTEGEIKLLYMNRRICNGCQSVDIDTDWTGHCRECVYLYSKE